jgi:hypothetical protein
MYTNDDNYLEIEGVNRLIRGCAGGTMIMNCQDHRIDCCRMRCDRIWLRSAISKNTKRKERQRGERASKNRRWSAKICRSAGPPAAGNEEEDDEISSAVGGATIPAGWRILSAYQLLIVSVVVHVFGCREGPWMFFPNISYNRTLQKGVYRHPKFSVAHGTKILNLTMAKL